MIRSFVFVDLITNELYNFLFLVGVKRLNENKKEVSLLCFFNVKTLLKNIEMVLRFFISFEYYKVNFVTQIFY